MSSQGSAAVLLLPLGLAVGAGILVAEGIMWCGRKMEENYLSACKSYTDLTERASAEQRAKIEDRQFILAAMIDQFTADTNLALTSAPAHDATVEVALTSALELARSALNSEGQTSRVRAKHEQALLRHQLQHEIAASKDFLRPDQIAVAQVALDGTAHAMSAALETIHSVWQVIDDTQQQREHQQQQAQLILADVRKELGTMRALLLQHHGQIDKKRSDDLRAINDKIELAEKRIERDAATALKDAESALRAARNLAHAVTASLINTWDKHRLQVAEARGHLEALKQIVHEAIAIQMTSASEGEKLAERITMLTALLAKAEAETGPQMQDALKNVTVNVALLKQDIFALVGAGQQQRIGDTIVTTLDELGFKAHLKTGGLPIVTKVGDSVRILARQQGQTPDFGRDEKLVVFYVDRDGRVTYDFSGYVGDACVHQAKRVFSALRAKGIVVVSPAVEQQLMTGAITPEMLKEGQFTPHFEVNKRQTHLHATLLRVLKEGMGFTHVEQRASGGAIEMDAFNGSLGYRYHVELTSEGKAKVKMDGVDVSDNPNDQLVAAEQKVIVPTESEDGGEQGYNFLSSSQQDTLSH